MSLFLLAVLPIAAAIAAWFSRGRVLAIAVTIASSVIGFGITLVDMWQVAHAGSIGAVPGWVALDGLGALLLFLVSFVGMLAALYSWGYTSKHDWDAARLRAYFTHFNLFLFSLVLVPLLAQPALTWIAIEFTAVFSVLLVGFDNSPSALEAAWKYIALMFMGATIALLGFFMLFWAQSLGGGGEYSWSGLRAMAQHLPRVPVTAAILLILVGFGTKVGFVPMHTWLPDAHSQAPSPVCALLSGVKTTAALYCILRLLPLVPGASLLGVLRGVGLVSAGVAAFLLLQVKDYKRLFAYSTVEHMGIIAFAAGLGSPDGLSSAMMQMLSHSLTKSFCFFAAGAALLVVGTREIAAVRGLGRTSPIAGAGLLMGALAIGGAPPSAVFVSEFAVLRAGLARGEYATTALLFTFVAVAFFGILQHITRVVYGTPTPNPSTLHHGGRLPMACVAALVLAAIPVLVLGVYQPALLRSLTARAVFVLLPQGTP